MLFSCTLYFLAVQKSQICILSYTLSYSRVFAAGSAFGYSISLSLIHFIITVDNMSELLNESIQGCLESVFQTTNSKAEL